MYSNGDSNPFKINITKREEHNHLNSLKQNIDPQIVKPIEIEDIDFDDIKKQKRKKRKFEKRN